MTRRKQPKRAHDLNLRHPPRCEDREVAGLLRDSVMLCRAFGWICNGHPASVVVKNQLLAIIKISSFSVPSSYEQVDRDQSMRLCVIDW